MKIRYLFSKVLLVLGIVFLYHVHSYSQCVPRVGFYYGEILPNSGCGSFTTVNPYSPGEYFRTPVLPGASYTISTCGSAIDTEITGFQGTVTATSIFYNDDNGPVCSGTQASITYVPNFNDYMRVAVQQFSCLPGGTQSITVNLRQNNNLTITSSSADMCQGQARSLTATPTPVTPSQPLSGDGGTFSGTGVSGTTFTAPTPAAASQVYTITYTYAYCSTTQDITVYKNPTTAAAGSDQVVYTSSTTLAANAPAAGTGAWSVISGTGTVTTPASPTSGVTGLVIGPPLVLRWTITNGPCTASTDDVIIRQAPNNNICSGAIAITCGSVITDSTDFATNENEVAFCSGPPGSGIVNFGTGVWYSFAGTGDTMELSTDNPGTNFDTELQLWSGSCGALTCIGGDDDGGTGLTSVLRFMSTQSTTYFLYVDGDLSNIGNYELSLTCPPPANDSCSTATALPPIVDTCILVTANYGNATASGIYASCAVVPQVDLWYSFVAPLTGSVEIDYIGGINAYAENLWPACGGSPGDELTCSVIVDGGTITGLTPDSTYYLQLWTLGSNVFQFCLKNGQIPPANDSCGGALPITCGSNVIDSNTWATTLDYAGPCTGPAGDGFNEIGPGLWYTFQGLGDTMIISTVNAGTNYDTELELYSGICGALACIGGDDDSGGGLQSQILFEPVFNETYYVYIDGHFGARGTFELSLECIGCPQTLNITGTPPSGDYQADSAIVSDATIQTPKVVAYKAGTEINLTPNFGVQLGAEFDAIIAPCASSLQEVNNARKANHGEQNNQPTKEMIKKSHFILQRE